MRIGEALAQGASLLAEHRIPSAGLDAEILLAHCLRVQRWFLHAHRDDPVVAEAHSSYRRSLLRRASREPIQYITGIQEFFGRPFSVDPSVLIPRPETEFLIEAVLARNVWDRPRIVDVGTGSGCIAVTLALEVPGARVFASDLSTEALSTALSNADALEARVAFASADMLNCWGGGFHFVVSNPPYVMASEKTGLQPEVRDHEPHLALFGRETPLDFYHRLFAAAGARLVRGGFLIVEIGYTMEPAVRGLLGPEWEPDATIRDLQGIPRVVAARWNPRT